MTESDVIFLVLMFAIIVAAIITYFDRNDGGIF
jgi:hypothetical protein